MPRNKLHDAALAGDAALVLSLIDESRQRRLAEARSAEAEARMAAIEAEANRRRSGALAAPPSPEGSVRSSRLSAPRSSKPKPAEPTSFIEANAADALGRTPLHIAAAQGSAEVVAALLQANCNHRLADKRGRTPLMEAASYGYAGLVEALLYAGPTPMAQTAYATQYDCAGWTALHDACYRGHVDVVHVLLGPPVDPVNGPTHGLELLCCATAADGATVHGNGVGQLMTPRQLAEQYSQAGAIAVIDDWVDELERRRDEVALQRRAAMVAAHQRLALAASMHKMIASKLHHRRLYLPAAWRPTDLLLQAIAGYMPEQASDGPADSVVQRFLSEGFVWRSMQERRIHRVALYVAKELEEDTSRKPRWKQDDPYNATVHPVVKRSATNLPPGTDKEWDVELRRKAVAEAAETERNRQRQLALAVEEERRRVAIEAAEAEQRLAAEEQRAAEARRREEQEAKRLKRMQERNAKIARQLASSLVEPDDHGPLGVLSVRIDTMVCSCERGSSGWLHFMDRVLNCPEASLPDCDMTMVLSAAGSKRGVVHRRSGRARITKPPVSQEEAAGPGEDAEKEVVLCWADGAAGEGEEELFDVSAGVFEASSRRSIRFDFLDIGVAEVDLRDAPSTAKRWKLRQWLELADEAGRHVASAHVQIKWLPAPPLEEFAAIVPGVV